MIGAALLAKKAVEKGLQRKPWVKTTLAPGSKVVSDYYEKSGLTPYLDKLGFNLVGYGCTTCIGNSGPLIPEVSKAVQDNDLAVGLGAVGQPQLRGPDQPRREDELPRLAAARRRLRARRLDGRRPLQRPAGPGHRRQRRVHEATSGRRRRRSRRSSPRRSPPTCSVPATPTSSPATSSGGRCRRPTATRSPGTPTRRTSASLRTSTACPTSPSRSPTSRAPGCCSSSATR